MQVMNLPVKAFCKTAEIRKDNTVVIGIQYCLTWEKRAKLDTGLSIRQNIGTVKSVALQHEYVFLTYYNVLLIAQHVN